MSIIKNNFQRISASFTGFVICWAAMSLYTGDVTAQTPPALPAGTQHTWTGGGSDDLWTTGANWLSTSPPAGFGWWALFDTTEPAVAVSNFGSANGFVIGLDSIGASLTLGTGVTLIPGNLQIARNTGSSGTLAIGNGGELSPIGGNVASAIYGGFGDATLNLNYSNELNLTGAITGNLTVNHVGSGTTVFTTTKAYSGTTNITAGVVVLAGNLSDVGNTVAVSGAGTLAARGGNRSIAGDVNVEGGGTLMTADDMSDGRVPLTLNIGGNLTLFDHSVLQIGLAAPHATEPDDSAGDLIIVGGNLTLAGTLEFNNIGGMDVGRYTIFTYGGIFQDNGMTVAGGVLANEGGRVVLDVGGALGDVAWWMGGNGIWDNNVANESWSSNPVPEAGDPDPPVTASWNGLTARFQNDNINNVDGGAVTVNGTVDFKALQFVDSGFTIGAGLLATLRVDDAGSELRANAGATGVISAPISGDGGLTKAGSGRVILTGSSNSWMGGTTISNGTLQIGQSGGSSGTLPGDVEVVGGQLAFSRDNYTYGGIISGSGGVQQVGGGRTVFTSNDHSYAGITSIIDGTLQVGTGATSGRLGSGSIVIGVDGTLAMNRSDDVSLTNTIIGDGRLVQVGSGTLTLEGNLNGFAGDASVEAGVLRFVNPIALRSMTVREGAMLSLHTVDDAIGSGDPTLSLTGDLLLESGSALRLGVNRHGDVDWIHADGSAEIGGQALVIEAGDVGASWQALNEYMILFAEDGVSGAFGNVTNNFAFLDASLTQGTNHVGLHLNRNDTRFGSLEGLSANQVAAGRGLEGVAAMDIDHPLMALVIPLSIDDAPVVFDTLSGEVHASLNGMLLEDSRLVRDAVLTQSVAGVREGAWLRLLGHDGHIKNKANTSRFDRTTVGLLVGSDYAVGEGAVSAGWVAGYHRSSAKVDELDSIGDVDSVHGAVYGGGRWDAPFSLPALLNDANVGMRLGAGYSWHQVEVSRHTFTDEALRSDYDANTLQIFGEVDYRAVVGDAEIAPFISVSWARLSTDSFVEGDHTTPVGGTTALRAASQSQSLGLSTMGVRTRAGDGPLSAQMMLGWRYAFSGRDNEMRLSFLDSGGAAFDVRGAPLSRSAAVIDLAVDYAIGGARIGLAYGGQIGKDARDHALRANLHITLP